MPLQDRRDEALVRRAFTHFALVSVGLVVVVVGGVFVVTEVQAEDEATDEAVARGSVVAAAVEAGLSESGEGPADPGLDEEIEIAARHAGVRAVLVWDRDGRVVWSTRSLIVGETFELEDEVHAVFGGSEVLAGGAGESFHRADPRGLLGTEVEVYTPITGPGDEPLVVESYVDAADVMGTARTQTLLWLLPIGAVGLILFEGLALLAGARLARRVQASRRERIKLLTSSLTALDHERRRIAHDLHDGVVQDLAAMRYALEGIQDLVPRDLPGDPHAQLGRVSHAVEAELATLRGTLGELLPVERQELPLRRTLGELVARLVPGTVRWNLELEPGFETVETSTAELAQRVVQEGVRNAVRHADPRSIWIRVGPGEDLEGEGIRVVVDDDGRGPDGARRAEDDGAGSVRGDHVGIRLLGDLVRDLDGQLTLEKRPGGGTRLVATWPASRMSTPLVSYPD